MRKVCAATVLRFLPMPRLSLVLTTCAIASLLAACGGNDGERETQDSATGLAEDAAATPLPAPMQPPGGAVTGMPDAPGPGGVPLAGEAAPLPTAETGGALFADGVQLPALQPAEGEALSPLRDAATGQGVALATGALPPLEDNPEAGLGPVDDVGVARAPGVDGGTGATDAGAAGTRDAGDAGDAAGEAAATVRAYYDAISAGDFRRAYATWSDGGRSSGRTPEQFASAFEGTRIVRVSIGAPGRVEGAAGSRYVQVPVTVTSRTSDGRELRQAGSFAMRSGQVEGAAQGWRIVSADLRELQP